jgi:filamentous hemagglutinin family protein
MVVKAIVTVIPTYYVSKNLKFIVKNSQTIAELTVCGTCDLWDYIGGLNSLLQSLSMKTQFKPNFLRLLYLLFLTWVMGANTLPARAQSITAAPDGTGTIINYNGNTYNINGGTQAGANLFHSFEEFGLNPQEIANFLSNPDILNIVGRVTGGNASIVQGLIQLTGGNSNLFLMNPSGWVFTQGASLDVPGSFGATTATRIGFEDNYFNAYGDNLYSELTGNPTSLIFDQNNPSWLVNEADLAVNAGESLWLVGGGIISTGTVEAEGGNITLAAVPGKNQIELSHDGLILDLILSAAPVEGSVIIPTNATGMRAVDIPRYLTGGSEVGHANEAIVEADGTVRLVHTNTTIQEGDTVIAGEINAGDIALMAAGRVTPIDNNLISNDPTVVLFPDALGDTVETSFIDEGVEDYQTLLYGGKSGTISQVVTHQENGIDVVTDTLTEIAAQGGEVSAVHLLNEGNEGEFWLGNAYVSNETISQYQAQLEQWGVALTPEADILLYACYTALGGNGIELVNTLAGLTGADVAASTNLTANAALGGDWNLEVQTGSIEASLGLEQWAMDDFTGKLQVFTASDAATLIAAITTANGNIQTDTINLAGDITLTAVDNVTDGPNGLPSITAAEKLTINGMGNTIARNATAPNFRLFHVALGGDLEINETTLSGGVADTGSTVVLVPADSGGAIFNRGTVTLNDSTVSGNRALNDGGAIYTTASTANTAVLNINRSTFSGNGAGDNGGAIANSVFSGAGPLPNASVVNIIESTFSGNSATDGGAVSNFGQNGDDGAVMNITNSTLSGNTASSTGGAIYNRGQSATFGATVTLTNSTVTNNEVTNIVGRGGGIFNTGFFTVNSGRIIVGNSIVAGNTAAIETDVHQDMPTANAPFVDQGIT